MLEKRPTSLKSARLEDILSDPDLEQYSRPPEAPTRVDEHGFKVPYTRAHTHAHTHNILPILLLSGSDHLSVWVFWPCCPFLFPAPNADVDGAFVCRRMKIRFLHTARIYPCDSHGFCCALVLTLEQRQTTCLCLNTWRKIESWLLWSAQERLFAGQSGNRFHLKNWPTFYQDIFESRKAKATQYSSLSLFSLYAYWVRCWGGVSVCVC